MTMKLSNKYNQLVVSNSGKASNEAIYNVYLCNDGTKVRADRTPMNLWTYQKGNNILSRLLS